MPRRPSSEPPADTLAGAQRKALRSLARREHSQRELRQKLLAGGVPSLLADAVVHDFAARGWQSDQRFAESLLRTRLGQGYGPMRIAAELGAAGVDDALIRSTLQDAGCDWLKLLRRVYKRRYDESAVGPKEWQRRYRFLAQRGFTSEQIYSVLSEVLAADEPPTP